MENILNKRGQGVGDWEDMIKLIIVAPILIAFIGAIIAITANIGKENCPVCPICDYSSYQNNLSNCTKQLNETPVRYVNITQYVNVSVPVEKIVYQDKPIYIGINFIILALSIITTIKLFKIEIKIKFDKETEKKLKEYDKWIFRIKWLSVTVTALILIRLIWAFFLLI